MLFFCWVQGTVVLHILRYFFWQGRGRASKAGFNLQCKEYEYYYKVLTKAKVEQQNKFIVLWITLRNVRTRKSGTTRASMPLPQLTKTSKSRASNYARSTLSRVQLCTCTDIGHINVLTYVQTYVRYGVPTQVDTTLLSHNHNPEAISHVVGTPTRSDIYSWYTTTGIRYSNCTVHVHKNLL